MEPNKMIKAKSLIFVFFFAISLLSCQRGHEKMKTTQTLKLDFQEGDLTSLHPHDLVIFLRGLCISKNMYEGLTRIDADGGAKLSGAQSVEVSPDSLHYSFTLRDNFWSDGTPVTAFQYENAWKEALSPTSTSARADLLYLIKNAKEAKLGTMPLDAVGVKALNAKTLIVDLANPSPHFLKLLAQPIAMPLKHPEIKEISEFNGPFMVTKWEKGSLLQLKPNPYFWNRQQVSLQQIDIYMIQDPSTTYSFFREGKLDYIGMPLCNLTSEQIKHLEGAKSLHFHSSDRVFWIYLNTQHPLLSSPWIRQALSMAIQRQKICENFLIGTNPMLTPLSSNLIPSPDTSAFNENLTEAQKRFDRGLHELGFTKETVPSLTISYAQHADRKQLAEYLQNCWTSAFGIDVQLESTDWNVLRNNLSKGLYNISFTYLGPYYDDPLELLDSFSNINSCNISQWVHPKYSEIINVAKQEKDLQNRNEYLTEAEHFLLEQMPLIPVCSGKMLFTHNPNLEGYVFDCLGAIDFSYASFKNW